MEGNGNPERMAYDRLLNSALGHQHQLGPSPTEERVDPLELPPTSGAEFSRPTMSSRKRNSTAAGLAGIGDAPRDDDVLTWSDSDHDSDIIDLRDPTKVPEILLQRQQKRADRVKLGAFQCAICMDHSTSLTVTHCENQKNKCPICRQKIENRSRDSYKQTTKGIWPLELKLMTTTRKGKRSHA
ncbi:unnamed protein product [Parascedosporium putredinis]|uniref:RING-type domain-containing protein n=1 Tax=Parascedosporium putredinis TaxID=1442378 RepID=A0A9P1MD74_9PEZI|nr:unnamed protein product [Parascedosporium putredinis]CAI8003070.1 unnamed protein product [Parascedosporium putredinis]